MASRTDFERKPIIDSPLLFTEHAPLANNNCIEVSHITTSRTAQLTENKQNVPHEVSHATVGTASLDPAAC